MALIAKHTIPSFMQVFPIFGDNVKRRFQILCIFLISFQCTIAIAKGGLHLGWCRGVGNPHHSTSCSNPPSPSITQTQTNLPTANQVNTNQNQIPPTTTAVPATSQKPIQQQTPGQVPNQVPQLVPNKVPNQVPQKVPYKVPQLTPGQVPNQVPQLVPNKVPNQVPQKVPYKVPQLTPGQVPNQVQAQIKQRYEPTKYQRPKIVSGQTIAGNNSAAGSIVRHRTSSSKSRNFIARTVGRHEPHNLPTFVDRKTNQSWYCHSSGYGRRYALDEKKVPRIVGRVQLDMFLDTFTWNVPARHPLQANCMIAIKRKFSR